MSEEVSAGPRSRPALRQTWMERFERFAAAGLGVAAFCQREGVSSQAFYYWKHKLVAQAVPADDLPRLLPVAVLAGPSRVEVVLPTGPVLRLASDCDLA